jgi:hypothetical protein
LGMELVYDTDAGWLEMKCVGAILLFAVCTFGQTHFLTNDKALPIPILNFDAKGNIVMVPSSTSSARDFDFLIGKWKLKHRKLRSRLTGSDEWEEFETVVEDFRILEGMGNMDVGNAVIDGKPWEGRTIRLFDPKTRLWSLYWVASDRGVMDPPVVGSFENGVGHFFTKDLFNGKEIIMLFRWDIRDKEHPIWSQAFSPDNGKTWEWNWFNRSERISDRPENGKSLSRHIPYPQPRPDSTAATFLPGIVSKDLPDFGSAFSPDGKSFYFARTEDERSKIYVTHHDGTNWRDPVPVSFTTSEYADADPAFAPDGRLYFISTRPKDKSDNSKDYDIWFVSPLESGRWSEPENLGGVNSDANEFYISFSTNGNMYFSSSRSGGFGKEDIYVSKFVNGRYEKPENLGAAINSEKSEYDPGISADENFIVFTSSNRAATFGGGDLYGSKLNSGRKWAAAVNLGNGFNSSSREYCSYFSPDAKYFFFSSQGDVKWIGAHFVTDQITRLLK